MSEKTIEARVLQEMRVILTDIARETAPVGNRPRVLSPQTVSRMQDCLSLISARERELNEERGIEMTSRPRLGDQKGAAKKVHFLSTKSSDKK